MLFRSSLSARADATVTLTFQNNSGTQPLTLLSFGCDLNKTTFCSYSFDNAQDPTKWLTVMTPSGDTQKWAVEGAVTLVNGSIGTSTTGTQLGTKLLVFRSKFTYVQGTAPVSTLTGLQLSAANIDFITSGFGKKQLFKNPTAINQLNGTFLANQNAGVNRNDTATSSINLVVSGQDSNGNPIDSQQINGILQLNSQASGFPSGTSFPFMTSDSKTDKIGRAHV